MNDNLRMLIGFVLIVLILILYPLILPRNKPVSLPPGTDRTPVQPAPAESTALYPSLPPKPVAESAFAPDLISGTTAYLENRFLKLEFTSIGGGLKSCYLKPYRVQLVPEGNTLLANSELTRLPATTTQTDSSVAFTYQTARGPITKTWSLATGSLRDDYTLLLTIDAPAGEQTLTFDLQSGIPVSEKNAKEDLANFHFYVRSAEKIHQVSPAQLRRRPFVATGDWAGLKSKYFFLALVHQGGKFDSVRAEPLPDNRIGFRARTRVSGSGKFLVYAGPIEYNRLRTFHLGFENVVSLGWLKPIALGILYILRLFYKLVHNWGWAIVFFSILMKGIFYPLSRTQMRQMRSLQLLQPKLEELKKKYKDDPQTLNQETMRLYQLARVNPLSGCLPLLVQMPVFFALYAVLRNFIELRGAQFILWLNDLSQPDTLFGHIPQGVPLLGGFALGLLPIFMGISFIAQNLLTATDKRNWALTIFFPIFITAIFLNLSSGLQLYWFIYNILSIVESVVATKGGNIWQKRRKSPNPGVK